MTFSNNLVFLEVMKNKELCKHLIEHVLHIHIREILYLETDKSISVRIDSKRIRLDVYVKDENDTVMDIERCRQQAQTALFTAEQMKKPCFANRRCVPGITRVLPAWICCTGGMTYIMSCASRT